MARSSLRCTTCSLALLLAASVSPARAEQAPEALVRELVATTQAMMDALATGESGVWDRALADDAVVIDEFGRRQEKAELVEGIRGLPQGMSGRIELLDPRARVYGDAAVLAADVDEHVDVFGQAQHVVYRMTATFVRRDGRWRMAAMHNVTVPTTPPVLDVDGLVLADYAGVYRYAPGRAFTVASDGAALSFATHPERPATRLLPVARDVFMDDGDEKNLFVFRRDEAGRVVDLVERRKFNDLVLRREAP